MPNLKKTLLVAAVAGVVTVGGAGAAIAYWSSNGSGSGYANTGSSTAFAIISTTTGPTLTPGGPSQTVTITVTNNGSGVQRLSGLNVAVANALTGADWTPPWACTAADFAVTQPTFAAQDIPAGGTYQTTATLAMVNRSANQDGCKGIQVPMYIRAS